MNLIKDLRQYIWTLPFIGAILILISIFTPSVYVDQYPIEEYYWMWGLYYASISGYGSRTLFLAAEGPTNYTMPIFITGLIPLLLIFLASIALLLSANAVRTGRSDSKNRENLWIVMGIAMIVVPIIYIIGIDITMMRYVEYQLEQIYGYVPTGLPDFWDVYDPGFAVIAPFVGAALSIGGSIASKMIKPRELPIFVKQKQGIITKTPIGQISRTINFCSECGHQLLYSGNRFCSHCGNEIKI